MNDDELRSRTRANMERYGIPQGTDLPLPDYHWDASAQCIVCDVCRCRLGSYPEDRELHTAWHLALAAAPEGTPEP